MIHRIIGIILLCISALGLHAQTLTPEVLFDNYRDARILRMASNNNDVIIAIQNSTTLIRSSDNGRNWHRAQWKKHSTGNAICFLDSNHCIISDQDEQGRFISFYSDDAGLTWSESEVTYPDSDATEKYASRSLIPVDNGVCLSTSDSGLVFITKDYGKKWQYRTTTNYKMHRFIAFKSTILGINDSGCIKTTDTGRVWRSVSKFPITGYSHYQNVFRDTVNVLISGGLNKIHRVISTDSGTTWLIKHSDMNLPINSLIVSYKPERTIIKNYINQNILISNDNWVTWDTILVNENKMMSSTQLIVHDTNLFVGGFDKTMYSIDLKRKKTYKISGAYINDYTRSQVSKDCLMLFDLGANIVFSTDDGALWKQYEKPPLTSLSDFYFLSAEKALAIGHGEKSGLFITNNGGKTWNDISAQLGESYSGGKTSFIDSRTGVVSVRNKENKSFLLSTTDGGSTWVTSPLDTSILIQTLICNNINNDNITVVAGASNKTELHTPIYISDNFGQSWVQSHIPDTITVQSIQVTDNGIVYVYAKKAHTNNSATSVLYRTTDSGKTWSKILKDKEVTGMIWWWGAMSAQKNLVTIVYPYSDSIMISNDYGNTWKQFRFYSYPMHIIVKFATPQLTLQNDTLYITGETTGTGSPPVTGGPRNLLFRFVLPKEMTTSVEQKTTVNEKNYTNLSVAPNPADETMSVHLQLSPQELRTTTLTLYSEQGVLIRDLTSELMRSGTYCSIETNTLSSGIYFLTIRSNTFSQMVPVVILH